MSIQPTCVIAMYNTIRSLPTRLVSEQTIAPIYTEVEPSFTRAGPLNWLYRWNRLWTCKLDDDMLAR